jgi:hypothetical protein
MRRYFPVTKARLSSVARVVWHDAAMKNVSTVLAE